MNCLEHASGSLGGIRFILLIANERINIMKVALTITLIAVALILGGCGVGTPSSAVIPIDLSKDITISNGDFELTIFEISILESKVLGDTKISLNASSREKFNLYEIRMRYTNLTKEAVHLSYKLLHLGLPNIEDSSSILSMVGYCEAEAETPLSDPTHCIYLPPSSTWAISGYQLSVPLIQPNEKTQLYLIIVLDKTYTEFQLSFEGPE